MVRCDVASVGDVSYGRCVVGVMDKMAGVSRVSWTKWQVCRGCHGQNGTCVEGVIDKMARVSWVSWTKWHVCRGCHRQNGTCVVGVMNKMVCVSWDMARVS